MTAYHTIRRSSTFTLGGKLVPRAPCRRYLILCVALLVWISVEQAAELGELVGSRTCLRI